MASERTEVSWSRSELARKLIRPEAKTKNPHKEFQQALR